MSKTVKLTAKQAKHVEWALGAMDDYWTTESEAYARDGKVYPVSALPRLEGATLTLSEVDEINDDLLYRLEEQLPAMARQAAGHWDTGVTRTAYLNAAKLIRRAIGCQ